MFGGYELLSALYVVDVISMTQPRNTHRKSRQQAAAHGRVSSISKEGSIIASSVLNPVATEDKYQIPSAKASAELTRRERFPSARGLKRESLPHRFRGLRHGIEVRFRFRA